MYVLLVRVTLAIIFHSRSHLVGIVAFMLQWPVHGVMTKLTDPIIEVLRTSTRRELSSSEICSRLKLEVGVAVNDRLVRKWLARIRADPEVCDQLSQHAV